MIFNRFKKWLSIPIFILSIFAGLYTQKFYRHNAALYPAAVINSLSIHTHTPQGKKCLKNDSSESSRGVIYQIMTVTAYTAGYESTGKTPNNPAYGITASSHKIKIGTGEHLAAAGTCIPFGTVIYIPGYGLAPILDRGDAISNNQIDVYFDGVEQARKWGKKVLYITIFR